MMLGSDRRIVIPASGPFRPAPRIGRSREIVCRSATGGVDPMRRLPAVLTVLLAATVARAADAPPSDQELQKAKQQAAFEQERLRRQFGDFQRSLLTLAQRYEKSAKA